MRLLIKYATRGRKELFEQAIANIKETVSKYCDYHILVTIDFDDESMQYLSNDYRISVFRSPNKSKIEAINRDMNIASAWDILVNFSDDMFFTVKDWDLKMLADIRSVWDNSTDFFAHFNDGFVGEKLPTMSVMGWDYYKRDNYIYHPSYNSVSCDAEAMYVAMMRGKHHYFPSVYFNHLHPANTRKPTDATYQGNHKFDIPDTNNYFERMRKGFYVENPVMIPDEVKKYMNE